jgi:hypothetical protein
MPVDICQEFVPETWFVLVIPKGSLVDVDLRLFVKLDLHRRVLRR